MLLNRSNTKKFIREKPNQKEIKMPCEKQNCETCEHEYKEKPEPPTAGEKWARTVDMVGECPLRPGNFGELPTSCGENECDDCRPVLAKAFDIGQSKMRAKPAMTAAKWVCCCRKIFWGAVADLDTAQELSVHDFKILIERAVADHIKLNKDKVIRCC